jgi:hypothetical protein
MKANFVVINSSKANFDEIYSMEGSRRISKRLSFAETMPRSSRGSL